ncbi:MAG: DUF2752 domain-containing protein [Pirellulales bacterium]
MSSFADAHDATTADLSLPEAECDRQARLVHQLRQRHWTMLWVSTVIVVAAFLLRVGESGRVAPKALPDLPLPLMCGSQVCFGVDCPGCGLTRSFVALADGDVAQSYRFHHVGWVIALAVLLQFPYRVYSLWELRTRVVERTWPRWFGGALIALLIGNWLGKVAGLW